ncbi:hypothetical protein FOL47_003842, partial [Perkinsus chesapeaki]
RIQEGCSFSSLVTQLMQTVEDYAWEGEKEAVSGEGVTLNQATDAAEWAIKTRIIFTDDSSRYFVIPSNDIIQATGDTETLNNIAAHYLLRYLNSNAPAWDRWESLRDAVENLYIIDSRADGDKIWCTCYKSIDNKKPKQEACIHCLGVKLLLEGRLGSFELVDLMPFAPRSRGRPKYDTTPALQINEAYRARSRGVAGYAARTASSIGRLPYAAKKLDYSVIRRMMTHDVQITNLPLDMSAPAISSSTGSQDPSSSYAIE